MSRLILIFIFFITSNSYANNYKKCEFLHSLKSDVRYKGILKKNPSSYVMVPVKMLCSVFFSRVTLFRGNEIASFNINCLDQEDYGSHRTYKGLYNMEPSYIRYSKDHTFGLYPGTVPDELFVEISCSTNSKSKLKVSVVGIYQKHTNTSSGRGDNFIRGRSVDFLYEGNFDISE